MGLWAVSLPWPCEGLSARTCLHMWVCKWPVSLCACVCLCLVVPCPSKSTHLYVCMCACGSMYLEVLVSVCVSVHTHLSNDTAEAPTLPHHLPPQALG